MFFDQAVSNRYFFQKETKMCPREYCTPLLQADCFGHRSRSHSNYHSVWQSYEYNHTIHDITFHFLLLILDNYLAIFWPTGYLISKCNILNGSEG